CKDCIIPKLEEFKTKRCPVCEKVLGPSPEKYLRPDKQLQGIIDEVIKAAKRAAGTKTSQAENTKLEIAESSAQATKPLLENVGFPEEIGENFAKDTEDAGKKGKKPKGKKKNKRRMKEKARQVSSSQEKGKGKVEPTNVEEENSEDKSSGIEGNAGVRELLFDVAQKTTRSFWVSFIPQEDEDGHKYPSLDKAYIRLKDQDMTVSTIRKYLKQKLNLMDESEVDVHCCGLKLNANLTLMDIEHLWLKYRVPDHAKAKAKWDVKEIVMELGYSRNKEFKVPKEN
ncbi:unnamed protein product, partial [Ilex paraguariensis]